MEVQNGDNTETIENAEVIEMAVPTAIEKNADENESSDNGDTMNQLEDDEHPPRANTLEESTTTANNVIISDENQPEISVLTETSDLNSVNPPKKPYQCLYTRYELLKLRNATLSKQPPNERDQLFLILRGLWRFEVTQSMKSKLNVLKGQESKQPIKFRQNFNANMRRKNVDDAIIMARKANNNSPYNGGGNIMYNQMMTNNFQSRYPSNDMHFNQTKYNGGGREMEYNTSGGSGDGGSNYDQYHWVKNRYQSFHQFQKSYYDRKPLTPATNYYHMMENENTNSKPDEPEWYSDGPTSKYDVIDLHGFNEMDEQGNKLEHDQRKELHNDKSKPNISSTPTKTTVSDSNNNCEPNNVNVNDNDNVCNQTISDSSDVKNTSSQYGDRPFNFDDFWCMDTHGYMNGSGHESSWSKKNKGSRFSKWFKSGDNCYKRNDSLDSSLQNELNKLMNESGELSNFDKSTESSEISSQLFEIMQKFNNKQQTKRRSSKTKHIQSVAEIEAKILNRSTESTNADQQQHQQQQQYQRQQQQNIQTFKTMLENTAQRAGVAGAIDGLQFLQNFTRFQQHEYMKKLSIQMQQKLFQQMLGSAVAGANNNYQQRQSFLKCLNSILHQQQEGQRIPSNNYRHYQHQQNSSNNSGFWMPSQHNRVGGGGGGGGGTMGRPILKSNSFENTSVNGPFEQKNLHVHFQEYNGLQSSSFGNPSSHINKDNVFGSQEIRNPIENCNV